MSRRPILIAVVAILLVAAGGGGYLLRDRLGRSAATPAPSSPQAASGLALAEALQLGFVDVAQHVRPAVVHLGTIQKAKSRRGDEQQRQRGEQQKSRPYVTVSHPLP